MPATIRMMSWNMQNYGTKGFNKFDLGELIAKILQTYNIDICAMIEIENNSPHQIANSIVVQLNNLGYHQNNWKYSFVNVGDEGVMFLWHEEAVGHNSFKGYRYTNNNGKTIAGPVVRDNNNAMIYFPKTDTGWHHLQSQPNGRRAAYCAFETNDGGAARRFTVLDIHTPDAETLIQVYSTKLYATAREAVRVETTDAIHAITQANPHAALYMKAQVDPIIMQVFGAPIVYLATKVTDRVHDTLAAELRKGASLADALKAGADDGVYLCVQWLKTLTQLPKNNVLKLVKAAALAGAMAATYMVASIVLPTAPAAARASVNAATDAARDEVNNANFNYISPFAKTDTAIQAAILRAAQAAAQTATGLFTFPAPPTDNVGAAILAGDFNINYPDTTDYSRDPDVFRALGGQGQTAYTGLENLAHPNPAAINAKTTRIGPTAFRGQRIYKLRMPVPIQHINPTQPNFVDLDVTSLIGVELLSYTLWQQRIKLLAQNQNKVWATIVKTYNDLIDGAFDSTTVINDTNYYKASKYDNIFVHGATQVSSAVVDVISELGSWVADASGQNRWPQALGRVNGIAGTQIAEEMRKNGGNPVTKIYRTQTLQVTYYLTTAVNDAQQAAVFFDKYVSDHLPVVVEISI